MKKLLWWLTGGRPMKPDAQANLMFPPLPHGFSHYAFTDTVSGLPIFHWVDRCGRRWIAEHRWSLFRMADSRAQKLSEVRANSMAEKMESTPNGGRQPL